MAQVNRYNFLRWSDAAAEPGQPDLPHAYWLDREHCGYMPIACPTEALSFYINTLEGSNYGTFGDHQLQLIRVDTGAVVHANIAGLSQHALPGITPFNYNFYATIVIPPATEGHHYFRIWNASSSTEVLRSNFVYVRTDIANLFNETVYVKFRHDRFFYNIKYHELPGFYQQFRIHLNLLEEQLETNKELYTEITTGRQRTFNSYINKFRAIESYYFDPPAHEAAGIMFEHSEIQLNGKEYSLKSSYKDSPNPKSKLSKGNCELYLDEFASANRC